MSNQNLCPECEGQVVLPSDAEVGEILTCSDCSSELEVRSLEPLIIELAPEEEEDWGE
ncbi:MAG: lysine biosynthesis protein LysW [Patescibacteria group bacterium]